jgi:chromosome segregation ATPase
VSDHVALKGLQTRRDSLSTELNTTKQQVGDALEVLNRLRDTMHQQQSQLSRLDNEIANFKKKQEKPIVTEHAILRYLERVVGLDIEAHKNVILPPETEAQIRHLGNGVYPVKGPKSFKIKVQNGAVVTVMMEGE